MSDINEELSRIQKVKLWWHRHRMEISRPMSVVLDLCALSAVSYAGFLLHFSLGWTLIAGSLFVIARSLPE